MLVSVGRMCRGPADVRWSRLIPEAVTLHNGLAWSRDFRPKSIISFLMVIMTLAEKNDKAPPPIVTIFAN